MGSVTVKQKGTEPGLTQGEQESRSEVGEGSSVSDAATNSGPDMLLGVQLWASRGQVEEVQTGMVGQASLQRFAFVPTRLC